MKALQVSDKQKDALKRNIYFTELAATRKVFFGDQTTAYQAYQLWNAYISPIYARRREFAERICDQGHLGRRPARGCGPLEIGLELHPPTHREFSRLVDQTRHFNSDPFHIARD
jgi:hypothetical protein